MVDRCALYSIQCTCIPLTPQLVLASKCSASQTERQQPQHPLGESRGQTLFSNLTHQCMLKFYSYYNYYFGKHCFRDCGDHFKVVGGLENLAKTTKRQGSLSANIIIQHPINITDSCYPGHKTTSPRCPP